LRVAQTGFTYKYVGGDERFNLIHGIWRGPETVHGSDNRFLINRLHGKQSLSDTDLQGKTR
jgi:hypothetical protein